MAGYGKLHTEPSSSKTTSKLRLKGWSEDPGGLHSDSDSSETGSYSGSRSPENRSSCGSDVSSESSGSSIVWLPHIEPDGRLFYSDVISERYIRKKETREHWLKKGRLKKLLRKKRKKKRGQFDSKEFTVLVDIVPNRHRKLSNYCHEYLGIISEPGTVQATKTGMLPSGPVIVVGLLEGCKLMKDGQVTQGDVLRTIGKHPVDHSNIELVLQQLIEPCVLALSFCRKSGPEVDKLDTQTMRRYSDEGILGFFEFLEESGRNLTDFLDFLEPFSCTCLLLNVDKVTDFSPEFADIFYEFDLFKFFGGKKRQCDLVSVRGSFVTLEKTGKELFGTDIHTSLLNINEVPHITSQQSCGKYTILFSMPATWCTDFELRAKVNSFRSVLEFMFKSAELAMQNEKEECDWLLVMAYLSVAAKEFCSNLEIPTKDLPCSLLQDFEVSFVKESFPVTSPIPKMVKDQLDMTLYDLEACDVSTMVTSDFENDYVFILGSLILFKNHLLSTHLPIGLTQSIYNFLNQHQILTVVQHSQVFQIVTWTEVYAHRTELKKRRERMAANSKWFLLVLVQDHITLCSVFETGSEDDKIDKVYLEPAMVEELEFALNEVEKMGIIDFLEKWFKKAEVESQKVSGSKENLIEPLIRKGSLNSTHSNGSFSDIRRENGKPTVRENYRKSYEEDMSLSDLSFVSDVSSKDGSSTTLTKQRKALQIIIEDKKRLSLTAGPSDVFATFFGLDYGRGVILASGEYRDEPLAPQLLEKIKRHAFEISQEFELSRTTKGGTLQEIGRLFTVTVNADKKKSRKAVTYWISGSLSSKPCRTITYICYDDGTPQEAVDAGLKLAFSV